MIKEGLEYLVGLAQQANTAKQILTEDRTLTFMRPDGELVKVLRDPPLPNELLIHDLSDFVDWVKRQATGHQIGQVTVVANDSGVKALVDTTDGRRYASIHEWNYTPEWEAMRRIMGKPVSQKFLWTELTGDLRHCFTAAIRMALGSIKVSASRESAVNIHDYGLTTGKQAETVAVEFAAKGDPKATQTAELPVTWEYQGPVYKGLLDRDYDSLDLRLGLDVAEGNLKFLLSPLGYGRFMDVVMADLLKDLREALKDVGNVAVFNATTR